ncbi:hypothetical protein Lser_V15G44847 [Lactuca serriola]
MNRSAEKLFGYEDYEALGKTVTYLHIYDESQTSSEKILERVRSGHSWAGQFLFRKRLGVAFMALVNKIPLYEDGELVGIVTVSSDATIFNKIKSENTRTYEEDPTNRQNRTTKGLNFKNLQWHPPQQLSSFVSNLTSKDILRKDGGKNRHTRDTSVDMDGNIADLEKPPKEPPTKRGFGFSLFKKTTASITIFHTGKVNVYDDILADKARALLQLAASPLRFPHEEPVDGNMLQQPPNINLPILQIVRTTDNYRLNKEESNISREEISGIKAVAIGTISLVNNIGTTISGSVPQDVRIVQLISIRRIGITPAFLVPLNDLPDADIIALSDRPWLLQTARHSLSYTSISFQVSTHATPVCSSECPNGILFVSDNRLHFLEMVHSKRLNVQKFHLGGTPRKVLYHSESKLLVVLRTYLSDDSCSSDICCVDPLSGLISSSFKLEPGETRKCMELLKAGNEQVLVVGTSLSTGPAIMPTGEAESTKGRLIVLCLEHKQNSDSGSMTFYSKRSSPFFDYGGGEQLSSSSLCSSPDDIDNNSCDGNEIKLEETEAWNLRLAYATNMCGIVLALCPYLDCYFLASIGSYLSE